MCKILLSNRRHKNLPVDKIGFRMVLIVSRSLWADGVYGIHISLVCIFNGLHSLYIKNIPSSGLVNTALRQCYSSVFSLLPSFCLQISRPRICGTGQKRRDLIMRLCLCGWLFSIEQLVICECGELLSSLVCFRKSSAECEMKECLIIRGNECVYFWVRQIKSQLQQNQDWRRTFF